MGSRVPAGALSRQGLCFVPGMSLSRRALTFSLVIGWLTLAVAASPHRQAGEVRNTPVQTTYSGKELFRVYCTACHGASGRGDGPLAANMKRPPPDLTRFAIRNGGGIFSTTLITRIIDGRTKVPGHGGPDMPVWGDAFKASRSGFSEESVKERIDRLAEYIHEIQQRPAP